MNCRVSIERNAITREKCVVKIKREATQLMGSLPLD